MRKLYFLKEIANVTSGIDKLAGGGPEDDSDDDRFKAVKVKSSVFMDHNSGNVMRSRLYDIVKAHRTRHSDLNNASDPIRSMFNEEAQAKLTKKDLDVVEKYADNLFHTLGVDVTFTNHFLDRANDSRNGKQITVQELITLFNKQYTVNGVKIRKMRSDTEAVLKDLQSDINSPVYFEWDKRTGMLEMRLKTTMRKKNFTSPDPILKA
jgi:hypothetical protein